MSSPVYVPDRGDLVWVDFDPQAGSEQSGHRPALVLSRVSFNTRTGFAYVVPITSQAKGYPDEFPLPSGLPVYGVILCDQGKSVDWRARGVRFVGKVSMSVVGAVAVKVAQLLL